MFRNVLKLFCFVVFLMPTASAYAQFGYHFGRNKIQYEDFDWQVMKTEHFDIYYYPEMLELAEYGAFFAEEAYEELQHKFSFSLNNRVPLIFYSSNLHFKQTNVTSGFIPDGVGGFFEFLKGRVVIPANGSLHRFRRVIRHEMVHVFTYNKLTRIMRDHRRPSDRFFPLWFTEGLAEYWSGDPDDQHEMVIRDALFTNYLVPLESMYRIQGSYVMYKQGEAINRFFSEVYGEEKILELIDNIWKDRDFRVVMEVTLQDDFEEISRKWLVWLKEQYYPEFQNIELPSVIAGGLSTEGFSAKPNFHRFADGSQKVYYVGNKDGLSNVYEVEVDSDFQPLSEPKILIHGEQSTEYEAFHLFESRISVSKKGMLAFVTKSGGQDVVHAYDLVEGKIENTYGFDNLIAVYSPSWSPDGDQLTFTAIARSGFSDIYVFSRNTGALQQLTSDSYDDRDPSWSPDGRSIAFSSDRTSVGEAGHYNIFTYEVASGTIRYVTFGEQTDLSPTWSPDGSKLAYISTRRDSTGKYTAQDIWAVDMSHEVTMPKAFASSTTVEFAQAPTWRSTTRLTSLLAASFDPYWADDEHIVFTSFEGLNFSIRQISNVDSLLGAPKETVTANLSGIGKPWKYDRLALGVDAEAITYKPKYNLDIAQGIVSQNSVLGTTGGAVLAFSDMLGDDYLYLTLINTGTGSRDFVKDLSLQLSRFKLNGRANVGYGAYRYSGRRYDVTDPDAPSEFPVFFETVYGGFGLVSYPLSKFSRVELMTSLNWTRKDVQSKTGDREALLLSNSVALVRDNALYWMNGPISGWRGSLSAGYTSDVLYSNVSYYSVMLDVRKYFRITNDVTFASWGMARFNEGREARLFVLGGSWDLRGFHWFDVRGQKMWFTSHELRFPLVNAPTILLPILAPFGVANLRGTLFFDAAHAWNTDYNEKRAEIRSGETLGSAGFGLRVNLFGSFVMRWDMGYRYRDGFTRKDKTFKQFFFGWDF